MSAQPAFREAAARPWWGLALSVSLFLMLAPWASPQAKEPSRTVYKCMKGKSVTYTDEPCHAAVEVDVTPTRGLDRSSGVERKGPEVRRELQREQLAEAIQPLTGMTTEQFNTAARRQRLPPATRQECNALDRQLSITRSKEQAASQPSDLAEAQSRLLALRKRFRDLAC